VIIKMQQHVVNAVRPLLPEVKHCGDSSEALWRSTVEQFESGVHHTWWAAALTSTPMPCCTAVPCTNCPLACIQCSHLASTHTHLPVCSSTNNSRKHHPL
jgi:hypothetical protein